LSRNSRTVLVVGGGIAGLTAALALAREGLRVEVFEQAEGFETIGAGIQLSPNALAVLDGLDLGRGLRTVAVAPTAIRAMAAETGREIVQIPLGAAASERYGRPYLVIHRADLQQVLAKACVAHPDIALNMGARIDDAALHANGATVAIARDGRASEHAGLALIAADGVRSRLREVCFSAAPARYSGMTAWRALIPAQQLPGSQDMEGVQLWLAPDVHAVTYPVRHGGYLNVVVIFASAEPPEGWTAPGDPDELRAAIGKWHASFRDLTNHRARWTRWPLYSSSTPRHFANGRAVLIGDAGHAMLPFAAQGAAMGIEDATVLARCLGAAQKSGGDIAAALARYEAERLPRLARAARLAALNRTIYHLPKPLAAIRDLGMRMLGGNRLLARQDWLYRWTPDGE